MSSETKQRKMATNNNRKFKVFLFFMVLTAFIWLLVELSKSYTTSANFRVVYKNIPTEKLLQEINQNELEIAFKAPGFTILKYKLRKHKLSVDLNYVSRTGRRHYVLPNMQISGLNSQLPGEIELVEVMKDTLFVALGVNKFKKVPVTQDVEINFKLGYNFTDTLELSPDSVVISGPDIYIDSINAVSSEFLKLDEVSTDIDETLALKSLPAHMKVVFETSTINLRASIDKFTEGSFTVPVEIINEPEGVQINPFPKEIEVTYQAGLSNFTKIDESSVKVVFDYKQYEKDSLLQFLTPVIVQKSAFISSLKINPPQIEFLVQK